jgi:hypothetical protein
MEEIQKAFNNVSFSINAEKQTMDLTLLPHGEDKPISFHINYKLDEKGDDTEIIVEKMASDRIWINEILHLWLEKSNFQYRIPQNLAGIIKMFLK